MPSSPEPNRRALAGSGVKLGETGTGVKVRTWGTWRREIPRLREPTPFAGAKEEEKASACSAPAGGGQAE